MKTNFLKTDWQKWNLFFPLFYSFIFLDLHLQHMEVPRLEVVSELQLPAHATVTATRDPSRVCDLHHSARQCWILNPLSEVRDQTCIHMDASQIHFCWSTTGTPLQSFWNSSFYVENFEKSPHFFFILFSSSKSGINYFTFFPQVYFKMYWDYTENLSCSSEYPEIVLR